MNSLIFKVTLQLQNVTSQIDQNFISKLHFIAKSITQALQSWQSSRHHKSWQHHIYLS